ncbi:hypothetical protein FHG87_013423 [Trinorchestia longiramus]|nr:hypothetical protein FHG87_013423 [Trinorchestia longiramus]
MTRWDGQYIWIIFILLSGAVSNPADDCFEVGYARSGGALPYQLYDTIKEKILEKWIAEDSSEIPLYKSFPGHLKNLTRAAYLLEAVSKEVLSGIRKTRVGKRCREEFLLRGLEKHVRPLMQLDETLATELQLVQSYQCIVGSPYPNVDGSCVSETSPDLGAVGSKFLRLLPAHPGPDGYSPRSTSSGSPLPNPVHVANLLRKHLKKPSTSSLFTEWAHFVQNDIFSIPASPLAEGVDCCESPDAEDCYALLVPESSQFHTRSCYNYKRSARGQAILGHRESLSLVSTYLDANPIYGRTNEEAFKRKAGYFGLLRGMEKIEDLESGCQAPESWQGCFAAATEDVKISPSVRALLVLEHNRVAEKLAELNPHFDDALLYNEARRIILATYQVITYGEYLPALMGKETVEKHLLYPGSKGPGASYIKEVIPGVLNSFALAAFRNPAMLTQWVTLDEGREELFGSSHYDFLASVDHQDMLAADIHRARDHGLTGYVSWRRFCEPGFVLDSWDDLKKIFDDALVEDLQHLYGDDLSDIDAMLALLEPPLEGGVAGKTFSCIMADQFARLRTGNKLFWEFEAAMMTAPMHEALRNVTLAALLCHNLPVSAVPKNPFFPVSPANPSLDCLQVQSLNMTAWVDKSLIDVMKKSDTKTSSVSQGTSDSESVHVEHEVDSKTSSVTSGDGEKKVDIVTSGVTGQENSPTQKMAAGTGATLSLTTSAAAPTKEEL